MPKPKKNRFVQQPPAAVFFKPQGIPLYELEQIVLEVDEYEAIRLVDEEGLHLEAAAEKLQVSRATCARIIDSAHKKIATALTHGHAIRIEGGSFVLGRNRFRCRDCGNRWEAEIPEKPQADRSVACPSCRSSHVQDLAREIGFLDGALGPQGPGCGRGPGGRGGRGWRRHGGPGRAVSPLDE